MQGAKVVGIITVTDLARYLRTMLLLQGALDSNKAAGFWSDNDTNDSDDHDGDNPSHNDKTNASTTTSITSTSTSISQGKANAPYNSIS